MVPTPRTQLVGYALVAIVVVALGVKVLGKGGDGGGAPAPPIKVDRAGTGGREGVYVHVAGAVRRPGLYRVRGGSRVASALERAGGLTRRAQVAGVNLAAPIEDGQQIVVPVRGPPGGGASSSASGAAAGSKVSLANATVEQLEKLDGIGPTLAKRIVEYRDSHGGFRSLDELGQVDGIGDKRLGALREAVSP